MEKTDKYTENLTQLTKGQLLEIKEREEKLLDKFCFRPQLAQLPDNGKKIKIFYERILFEISQRDEIDESIKAFSDLNIVTTTGQEKLTNLECIASNLSSNISKEVVLCDDEKTDPLKIIAQSSDMIKHEPNENLITNDGLKIIENMKEEQKGNDIVVDSNLVDIKICTELLKKGITDPILNDIILFLRLYHTASSTSSLNLEPHALYLLGKGLDVLPKQQKFLPFKTTKTNVHDPEKEKTRKVRGKYWEVTAATPRPIQNPGVKLLSLIESIEIQAKYRDNLKKLQEKEAEDCLKAKAAKPAACNIILPSEEIRKNNKFFESYHHHDLSSNEFDYVYEDEKDYEFDEDFCDEEDEKEHEFGYYYESEEEYECDEDVCDDEEEEDGSSDEFSDDFKNEEEYQFDEGVCDEARPVRRLMLILREFFKS